MVCQIYKRRHQSVDAACVSAAQCIVRGVQIFALLFPMFFTEVIGKQRPNMAFNLQYVLQKELPQILIKIIQRHDVLEPRTILVFPGRWILKGCLVAANQAEITDLFQHRLRIVMILNHKIFIVFQIADLCVKC